MNKESMSAVLDDCILIDRELTPVFEENAWVPEDITLEVSSPGIDRKLRTKRHFDLSIDKRITLKYRGKLNILDSEFEQEKILKNKVVTGFLKEVKDSEELESITMSIPCKKGDAFVEVNCEQILNARWEPEF